MNWNKKKNNSICYLNVQVKLKLLKKKIYFFSENVTLKIRHFFRNIM